jgi:Uma2 family endonuclease
MQIGNSPPGTTMEIFKMLPEGTLAEIINGSIIMSPAPTPEHQRVIRDLSFQLHSFVNTANIGEILFSPCDVFLDEHANAVQPDIIFITKGKLSIIQEESIHGSPDMIIEVLSPGNPQQDWVKKKELYERFRISEYWLVDPVTKDTTGFALVDGIYRSCGQFKGVIHSVILGKEFPF